MKRLLTGMLCAFFLSGCGIDYLGSTKMVFEGRITDPDGQPVEGITVSTQISNSNDLDIISYDVTDSNGNYRMIFPKAAEKVEVQLLINETEDQNDFSASRIFNIHFDNAEDYTIDFGDQPIYQSQNRVQLTLSFATFPPQKIHLIGMVENNRIDYNFDELPEDNDYWYENDYFVEANQVITLRMLDVNGNISEVQIPVGNENLTYTVE